MRRVLMALVAGLLLLPAAVLTAPAAHACSCAVLDPGTAVDEYDLVAEVRVRTEEERQDRYVYDLEVRRAWKGTEQASVEVSTAARGDSCGSRLREGRTYLLFASGDEGSWVTGLCAPNSGVDATDPRITRAQVVDQLGGGIVPEPPSDESGSGEELLGHRALPWLLLGGVVVVLGGVAGGLVLLRGSR